MREAIRGSSNQTQSDAIRPNQTHSDPIRRSQTHSYPIGRNQTQSDPIPSEGAVHTSLRLKAQSRRRDVTSSCNAAMVWLELDPPKLGCELVPPKLGFELVPPKLGWMPSSDGQGVEAREATCELARDRSRCDEATSRSARRCAADKSCDRGHHVHSGRPSGWSLERQSAVISRHQPPSAVISRHQPPSAVISRHQPPSAAISRHQSSSSYLFKLLDVCTRHSELTAHLAHLALARLPLRLRVEHETATARRLGHQRRLGRRWLGRSARRSRRRSGCARPSQIRASVLRSRFISRARRELEVRQPLLQLRVLLKLRGERRT